MTDSSMSDEIILQAFCYIELGGNYVTMTLMCAVLYCVTGSLPPSPFSFCSINSKNWNWFVVYYGREFTVQTEMTEWKLYEVHRFLTKPQHNTCKLILIGRQLCCKVNVIWITTYRCKLNVDWIIELQCVLQICDGLDLGWRGSVQEVVKV